MMDAEDSPAVQLPPDEWDTIHAWLAAQRRQAVVVAQQHPRAGRVIEGTIERVGQGAETIAGLSAAMGRARQVVMVGPEEDATDRAILILVSCTVLGLIGCGLAAVILRMWGVG